MLAGARRALFVMVGVLVILWAIQIVNWADHYGLAFHYGIRGRDAGSQSVSELDSAVTVVALPLSAVVLLHSSIFQVGLLSAASTVPFLHSPGLAGGSPSCRQAFSASASPACSTTSPSSASAKSICPPELLGWMNAAIRGVVWGTLPLGGVIGGALGAAAGVRATLWIGMTRAWLAGLWVLFSPLRGMRDIPAASEPGPTGTPPPAIGLLETT